jgi:serine protease Do
MPERAPEGSQQAKFGISIRALTEAEIETLPTESKTGLLVTRVEADSFADEIGLMEKDVIVSINRQPVGSLEDVKKLQSTLKPGDPVAFRVLRPLPRGVRGTRAQYQSQILAGTLSDE